MCSKGRPLFKIKYFDRQKFEVLKPKWWRFCASGAASEGAPAILIYFPGIRFYIVGKGIKNGGANIYILESLRVLCRFCVFGTSFRF